MHISHIQSHQITFLLRDQADTKEVIRITASRRKRKWVFEVRLPTGTREQVSMWGFIAQEFVDAMPEDAPDIGALVAAQPAALLTVQAKITEDPNEPPTIEATHN